MNNLSAAWTEQDTLVRAFVRELCVKEKENNLFLQHRNAGYAAMLPSQDMPPDPDMLLNLAMTPDSEILPNPAMTPDRNMIQEAAMPVNRDMTQEPAISLDPGMMSSPGVSQDSGMPLEPNLIRRDFPILSKKLNGKDLVWFDNGATTQKPRQVIERLCRFYENENSNVHRGAHDLAVRATDAYEGAREKVRRFLHAAHAGEIIFTRGTTESINLVAASFGKAVLQEGDEVIVSELEHHANIVPWQIICKEKGAKLLVWPIDQEGNLEVETLQSLFSSRTKIVAVTQVSNVLGTAPPLRDVILLAHQYGAAALVDGAQGAPHMPVDVQALDCDFYAFSGHKIYGPTGIGVLYAKKEILENMEPYQAGGNMISDVTFEQSAYQPPPHRFEAGTGNIADAAGLGAAIDYVSSLGMRRIEAYETGLLLYALETLGAVPKVRILASPQRRAGVISLTIEGASDQEVGQLLNREGIAVRAGHHCAQPVLRRLGRESSVRVTLSFYNTPQEIDFLADVLRTCSA